MHMRQQMSSLEGFFDFEVRQRRAVMLNSEQVRL